MNKNLNSQDFANQSQLVIRKKQSDNLTSKTEIAIQNIGMENMNTSISPYEKIVTNIPVKKGNEQVKELPIPFDNDSRKCELYSLALLYIKVNLVLIFCGLYYFFNGWHYELDTNINSSYIVAEILKKHFKVLLKEDIEFVKNILKANANLHSNSIIPNNPDYILFKNCLLDVNTCCMYQIGSGYFATGAINANFIPSSANQCTLLDDILMNISNNTIELFYILWEVIAYSIMPEFRQRLIFCFIGIGGSGKSMLLKVIENLLTPSLIANMSIQNLVGSRFALSELIGKRVCIASDEGQFKISTESSALLKRISGGGETMTADVKCQNQVTFVSTAKILIASNNAIHISAENVDPFLYKRMIVIPFMNSVPIEQQDMNLIHKILSEKDIIASKAFYVFQNLQRKNFKFSGDEAFFQQMAETITGQYSSDPLTLFSTNFCEFKDNAYTSTIDLFTAFQYNFPFSAYNNISAFSRAFKELNSHRIDFCRKRIDNSNNRGFKGVILKNN